MDNLASNSLVVAVVWDTTWCVCYGHSTPVIAAQSLRLIGGRSPGSQDSRRPRHLPSPRRRRTLHRRGLRKTQLAQTSDSWESLQIQGARRKNCPNFHMKLFGNRSIYCAYFSSSYGEQDEESTSGSVYRLHVEIVWNSSITHPGKDAEHVSTVESSMREQSRHGTCSCTTTGTQHHTKELDLWNSTVQCTVCTVHRRPLHPRRSENCWNKRCMISGTSTAKHQPRPSPVLFYRPGLAVSPPTQLSHGGSHWVCGVSQ